MKMEREGYPILTSDQTREMDARVEAEYGLPLAVLMENAGRAVADAAGRYAARRIIVAAGSGNNGGDALVAARMLLGRSVTVAVAMARPADQLTGLPALATRRYLDAGGEICRLEDANWDAADLVIDGLLGTGMRGEVREPVASAIAAINAAGRPVISIDVPSGLDSDSSAPPPCAVRSTVTVTLGCYKPGIVHFPAAEWAGEVRLADIGFPRSAYPAPDAVVLAGSFIRDVLPRWGRETHKGARGSLLVVAGCRGMVGAAAMCASSATHAGAGLVYVATPQTLAPTFEVKLTESVLRPVPDGGLARFTRESVGGVLAAQETADALVLGPGLGTHEETAGFTGALLDRATVPAIIDADGLNLLAAGAFVAPANAVLTPHPGEMARLLQCTVADVQRDRIASARRAADKFGCVVVLKGAHSVIAAPGRVAVVNTVSDPVLATAGSGDVLSGVIGALLAQGVPPPDAAVAGVRWHGTAGVLASSKWGGTLGATAFIRALPLARDAILGDHELEVSV